MPMPMDEIFYYRLGQKRAGGGTGGGTGGGGSDEGWINDGNTHIWISLPEGYTSPMMGYYLNGTMTIDWGDGTEPEIVTATNVTTLQWTPTHNYATAGDYVITLTVDGEMAFGGSSTTLGASCYILRFGKTSDRRNAVYANSIEKLEIGNNVIELKYVSFYECGGLKAVKFSDSVTKIGSSAFVNCRTLAEVVIPNSVISVDSNAFAGCSALKSAVISNGAIQFGISVFTSNKSLINVVLPEGITALSNSMFKECASLIYIIIPDSVTEIRDNAFALCSLLDNITIGKNITKIGQGAFYSCQNLGRIRFDATTPPTLSNSNAFYSLLTRCIISVPTGSLEAYTTATNYPDPATYTYIEED